MKHGLSEDTLREIRRVLGAHPQVESAILYSSRAKGNARIGSDIDLVITGEGLDRDTLGNIRLAFDEGPLPYRFDVAIREKLSHRGLIEHINRVGISIYERAAVAAP